MRIPPCCTCLERNAHLFIKPSLENSILWKELSVGSMESVSHWDTQ